MMARHRPLRKGLDAALRTSNRPSPIILRAGRIPASARSEPGIGDRMRRSLFPPSRGLDMAANDRLSIMGTRHVISAGHYLAAHAGFEVLEAGGNAIDAGVAAGIAIGVLQTDKVNF